MNKYNIQRDKYSKAVQRRKYPTGVMFEAPSPVANAGDIAANTASAAATGFAIGGPIGAGVLGAAALGSELYKRSETKKENKILDEKKKAYEQFGNKALDLKKQAVQAKFGRYSNKQEVVEMEKGEVFVDGETGETKVGTIKHEDGGNDIAVKGGDMIFNTQKDSSKRNKILHLAEASKYSLAAKSQLMEEAKKLPQGEVKSGDKFSNGVKAEVNDHWIRVSAQRMKDLNISDEMEYLNKLEKEDNEKKAFRDVAIKQGENYDDWAKAGDILGAVPTDKKTRYKAIGPKTIESWRQVYKEGKYNVAPQENTPIEHEVDAANYNNSGVPSDIDPQKTYSLSVENSINSNTTETRPSIKERLSSFANKVSSLFPDKSDKPDKEKVVKTKEEPGILDDKKFAPRFLNETYNTLRGLSGSEKTPVYSLKLDRFKNEANTEALKQDVLKQQKIFEKNADNAFRSRGESSSNKLMTSADTFSKLQQINQLGFDRRLNAENMNIQMSNEEKKHNTSALQTAADLDAQNRAKARSSTSAASYETEKDITQQELEKRQNEIDRLTAKNIASEDYKLNKNLEAVYSGNAEYIQERDAWLTNNPGKNEKDFRQFKSDEYIKIKEEERLKALEKQLDELKTKSTTKTVEP